MAAQLGVSSAYLSALERGERGKPTWTLIQGVIQYFNIIWDDADELARLADLSDPRVKIETAGASLRVTFLRTGSHGRSQTSPRKKWSAFSRFWTLLWSVRGKRAVRARGSFPTSRSSPKA
jgi:transcriptional regulator with XRE-family HTH domain